MTKKSNSTHVLVVLENNLFPIDTRVKPHVDCLRENGYAVTVISPAAKGFAWHETIDGVRVFRFPSLMAKKSAIGYLIEFAIATFFLTALILWVLIRHGVDILLFYNPPDILFILGIIPKLLGKTIVFDVRDISPELFKSKFDTPNPLLVRLLLSMEFLSCQVADHVITVNESYRRILQERNRLSKDKFTIVRQGPDLKIVKLSQPVSELRNRAKTIFAYLGNMSRQDGVEHLLYALSELNGHQDWLCVLIGGVDEPEVLNKLADELGIADKLWFTGFLPFEEWVPLVSTADICVEPAPANPLNSISTMNKIMDYMALGKPSVVYDLPEHRVTAAESALYAKPNDPSDLARQIIYLMDHPDERERIGAIGRARVEKELALAHQREHLLKLFSKLSEQCDNDTKSGIFRETSRDH